MRYKLKLKQLDFVSLVDDPAQPNAKCLLIKRRGNADEVSATARLVKTSDELGLAFFWAFTTTEKDGSDHYDLHGDQVLADNDMIKAAAAFMEKGGAADEMHDSEQTGRVVFAMPMTPEIAKAYGVETKTSGLMVALRPSPDAMAKLKDGTYTAVSIAGLGERIEARKAATKVVKSSLYTDEVDGHQHKICVYDDGSMYAEHATMAGAEYSHGHGIVFEGGTLTILADSGHSHTLAEGLAGVVAVPADAIVVVQARLGDQRFSVEDLRIASKQAQALAEKSTRSAAVQHAPNTMKVIALTESQHAHYSKLATADAEAFIAKSSADRDVEVAKALDADPIQYTGEHSGIKLRKSEMTSLALGIAKVAEEQATLIAKQKAEIAKANETAEIEKSKREATELRKRAEPMFKGLAGADAAHDAILKAVEETKNEDALTALKAITDGARKMMADASIAKGMNPGEDPIEKSAPSEYEELIAKTMTDDKCDRPTAADKVLKTKRGQELYAAISKSTKTNK